MLAQTLMILTAAPLAWVPIGDTGLLAWLVCLHYAFVGLQDVAVDALAVDILESADRERPRRVARSMALPQRSSGR